MLYYAAIKKNEILPLGITWMDLEGIILSEISRTEKHHRILLTSEILKTKQTNEQNWTYEYKEQITDYLRGEGFGVGKIGEGDQEIQTSSYKISKS